MPLPHVTRSEARCRETAFRQRDHGIETERLGGDRAADPREGRGQGAGINLEYLNRLPRAVVHDVQGMATAIVRFEIQAVRAKRGVLPAVEWGC